ncbi:MAG: hypothetical protein QM767_12375 [Anaeromyxobacter sp.]
MRFPLVLSAAALAAACATSSSQTDSAAPAMVENTGVVGQAAAARHAKLTVKVKSIDKATRHMTVEGEGGATESFAVPPEVKRFDEIAVGDTIVVEAEQGLLLEYQPPGSATVEPTAVAAGAKAGATAPPAGAVVGGVQSTVTVTAIDTQKRLVTFQGPAGNSYQVAAGPKVQLDKLKVGDKLLATYVESLAIGIEKPKL